ncbi:MAG: glycosyltransferase family 4 protein [Dehalococcoidia bacterium]
MKVLMFLSNAFTSDLRVYNEARSLLSAGHEVTVIAWDREKQSPPRQNWDGIEVVRLRTRLLPKRYRYASPFWVGFNLILWQWQAYRRALLLNKQRRFGAIHCHDFDTLAIGTRLKRKLKIPLVYDAHEIYGYITARLLPSWVADIFLRTEKRLIKKVDRMITDGEGRKRYFEMITDRPISVVMNCKPLQSLEYQPPNTESFTLLYIGTLWQSRMPLGVVEAARELPGVRCLIGGIGRPDYVQALKEECLRTSNVTFLGRVPFDEVIPMTLKAHAVVYLVNPDHVNIRLAMPHKIGEAMVCGRPIICTKGTYSGEITEREQTGLVIQNSVDALRKAIIKLRDNPELGEMLGRNALKAAIAQYNWQKQEEKLLELYRGVVNGEG